MNDNKDTKKPKRVRSGDKALEPKPGIPLDKNQVIPLIHKYKGNISRVADSIGCNRKAVHNLMNRDPEIKEMIEQARERMVDELVESSWAQAIETKDTALKIFMLKTQAKDRGFSQEDIKDAISEVTKTALDFVMNRSKNPTHE